MRLLTSLPRVTSCLRPFPKQQIRSYPTTGGDAGPEFSKPGRGMAGDLTMGRVTREFNKDGTDPTPRRWALYSMGAVGLGGAYLMMRPRRLPKREVIRQMREH
ncbi:uncharacterized protein CTHT_0064470 [Thermochaetoides thermophila DSM 1495]|uniref:Uncharacterized protein n=1 Tax=Chaetomium thermophilum (strain DSM 1495 / CBS 144.50 / IMI 039719) TaxID=759272 RepID=G0SEP4_CHATD|nr:hypothetical protein CTHT_0064470 [Thermochaetoides thermophila DSM 1495]EGS18421.1 hypothetical protein CTHT_0064470 [Thermochaetoides thermophila DSM 1495]